MSGKPVETLSSTLSFDEFWSWIQNHPNCIIRAGTPEAILYDDEDLHWHFTAEASDTLVVQLMRGKRLVGEILVAPTDISYVQGTPGDEQEYVFELITETPDDRVATYHFVLSHGYEEAPGTGRRAVH